MRKFMPFHFILQILSGVVVGWLAGLLVQGEGMGLIADLVIGVLGSVLGNTVVSYFHIHVFSGFWGTLSVSVGGAVVLLIFIRMIKR
jgi:uncharacterized membrane protein YeaQ/YmgE (transglycosylase-associated protein family)